MQTLGPDSPGVRGATIDEVLSDQYVTAPNGIAERKPVQERLRAWTAACAAGDHAQFVHRLARDGWTVDEVTGRLTNWRPISRPKWVDDASWVQAVLTASAQRDGSFSGRYR